MEFANGRYRVRLARDDRDLAAVRRLRFAAFRATAETPVGLDMDSHDARCRHLLVERAEDAATVATCRYLLVPDGPGLNGSYSAQFYDLAGFSAQRGPFLEIGRFCIGTVGPDAAEVVRLIWAALTRIVDGAGVQIMFGCSSFRGSDVARHADALAYLAERHLGPAHARPVARGGERHALLPAPHDPRRALSGIPTLLRTYLAMGGWVGGEAVVDRDLDTLHVFTAVRIADIPPARARLLRMDAAQALTAQAGANT